VLLLGSLKLADHLELRNMGSAADSEIRVRHRGNYMDFKTTPSVGLLHSTEECTSCYEGFLSENLFVAPFPQFHYPVVWRIWSGSERRSKDIVTACASEDFVWQAFSLLRHVATRTWHPSVTSSRFTLRANGPRTTTNSLSRTSPRAGR
jgi:hypothetical protein